MKYKIGRSKIHGKGVICSRPIRHGETIALVFERVNNTGRSEDDWNMKPMGKYVNHSWKPNARLIRKGHNYYLQATQNINVNDEITANYNDSPDFISKADPMWD